MKAHLFQTRLVRVSALALLSLPAVTLAQTPPERDVFQPGYDFGTPKTEVWPRFFRLGALVGLNMSADFSISGQFNISRSRPGAPGSGGDHFYDDGYVRVDETGNAQGYTSYWGYNNAASQLSGNTLTMHSSRSFAADSGASSSGDATALGLDLAYGGLLRRYNDAYIGWEFGFGYLPVSIDASHSLVGNVTRTVHSFDTGGITLPNAPYNGGSSGIGPTIHDLATALPDQNDVGATLAGTQTLDADMFLFRIGPVVHWELGSRVALDVSLGAAAGLVSGDLKFHDTLTITADGSTALNTGKESDSDFAYGGYVNGTLKYHVERHGDLYLSLQYMPMSTATIEGGGRRAELDMMGSVFVSAGINWPF